VTIDWSVQAAAMVRLLNELETAKTAFFGAFFSCADHSRFCADAWVSCDVAPILGSNC
jgi:hypothetical protein